MGEVVDLNSGLFMGPESPHALIRFEVMLILNINFILLHSFLVIINALPDLAIAIIQYLIMLRFRKGLIVRLICSHLYLKIIN